MRAVAFAGILLVSTTAGAEPPAASPAVSGPPRSCVLIQNIRETRVVDDATIDFVMRNGEVLRNTLPNRCPQLGFQRAFSYRTSINQLCSVDIITVIQQVGGGLQPGPSCGLGKFTPIAAPARKPAK